MAAVLIASCGGSDSSEPTGSTDDSADATTPADGQTLTVAAPAVLSSLDPERYEGNISLDLLPNMAATLLWWNRPEPGATSLQAPTDIAPALAESYEVSDDRRTVTFTLRDDAKSPYGNTVTSEDVRWSFERAINTEGVPIGRILMTQAGWDLENPIEVIDDKTFTLNIEAPNAVSLSVLTTYYTTILDSVEAKKHATDEDPFAYNWLSENDASFGAYTVSDFQPGTQVTLAANPGYYGEKPAYETVVVRAVPDGSSRLQLIEKGEIGVAFGLSFDQLASIRDGDGGVRAEQMLFPSIMQFVMNHAVEPFDDVRVREAVALAVDRDALVNAAYQGFGVPSTDFMHNAFGYSDASKPLARDLDRARELLTEAGVADGLQLELAYSVGNLGPEVVQLAVLLRDQLAEIGIDVTIRDIPSNAEFDAAKRDGSLTSWVATSAPLLPDPAYFIQTFFGSEGIVNLSGYGNPDLDDLAVQILETSPGAERDALVLEANDLMISDMPTVPLVDTEKYYVFSPGVEGFVSYPQDSVVISELKPAGD